MVIEDVGYWAEEYKKAFDAESDWIDKHPPSEYKSSEFVALHKASNEAFKVFEDAMDRWIKTLDQKQITLPDDVVEQIAKFKET
jgi:hypothetical protein